MTEPVSDKAVEEAREAWARVLTVMLIEGTPIEVIDEARATVETLARSIHKETLDEVRAASKGLAEYDSICIVLASLESERAE